MRNVQNINIIVLFISLIILFFTSCSKSNEGRESNRSNETLNNKEQVIKKQQIEIKFMGQWLGQGDRELFVREFVKEYNFLNQHIKINLIFQEDFFGKKQGGLNSNWMMKQVTSEKSEFDIIVINNNTELIIDKRDWASEYLVDFSKIEGFSENTKPGLINDSLKKTWSGIIPGPLIEGSYYALWCNNKVAKKVGINVKQVGMTVDDFLDYIKATQQYNQSHKDDYIIPLFEAGDWRVMITLATQIFESFLDNDHVFRSDEVSEQKLEAWYKTLKVFEQLAEYNPFCPQWDTMVWDNNYKIMLEDKCLFFSNGSWMYNFWQDIDRDKVKNMMPTEYPVVKPVNYYPGAYQIIFAVPKNAPHKEEAIKILMAMNSSRFAEKWVRYTKCPTGIKGKLASVSMGVDKFEDFTYQIQEKYGMEHFFSNNPRFNIFNFRQRNTNDYIHDVLTKQLTPEEAMEKIRQTLKAQNEPIVKYIR